jgi:hypothetical protein
VWTADARRTEASVVVWDLRGSQVPNSPRGIASPVFRLRGSRLASRAAAAHYRHYARRHRIIDCGYQPFAPRKQNITVYIMSGFDRYDELMSRLGKHACGKSCLYIKRLADVHLPTLEKLVNASVKHLRKTQQPGA